MLFKKWRSGHWKSRDPNELRGWRRHPVLAFMRLTGHTFGFRGREIQLRVARTSRSPERHACRPMPSEKCTPSPPGCRWDQGERHVLLGLAAFDLHDVDRRLHGDAARAYSWYPRSHDPRRQAQILGCRFDHGFASASLHPVSCMYLDAFRASGLSDHAALEVVFLKFCNHRLWTVLWGLVDESSSTPTRSHSWKVSRRFRDGDHQR
jgi:hypothetical protein